MEEKKNPSVYEQVVSLFHSGISSSYLGEDVMLVEHMIQCGELALDAGAEPALVVAALLHDVGHLLVENPQEAQDEGRDLHHDEVGARWVAERFPAEVADPIRLHVAAKRYLVATDTSYLAKLSLASVITLEMQGGAFTSEECQDFQNLPGWEGAIQVRRWDDRAKLAGKQIPDLSIFQPLIESLALKH